MTDLFTDTDNTNIPAQIDPAKDYLAELVGEGKKYSDAAALARSRVEADAFIERLKTENAGLRTELQTRSTLEQVLDKLSKPESNEPPNNSNNQQSEPDATALKPEDIAKLIDERVNERERAKQAQTNLGMTRQVLEQAYGSNYAQRLLEETSNLGLTKEFVNNLAQTAPKALFAILKVDENSKAPNPNTNLFVPPAGVRSQSVASTSNERNNAYYNDLRKKNPSSYWSPEIQNQMHKDAIRLGENFYS